MKKCILSAIAGALAMLAALIIIANVNTARKQEPQEYEHIDYVSNITQEECFVCGDSSAASCYWGEANVGIVNLNTFELLYLGINRYDDYGELIEETAGVMLSNGLIDNEAETYVHAYSFPDNAYAQVQFFGVKYAIDRGSVQNHLCQTCLDMVNVYYWTEEAPPAYAIINFSEDTVRPLDQSLTWFLMENYGIDCEFKENGNIDLRIIYCPSRYI